MHFLLANEEELGNEKEKNDNNSRVKTEPTEDDTFWHTATGRESYHHC